jgi:hypothetical protein
MKTIDEQISSVAEVAAGDISVFLGAGASAAVGLPTMVSFLDNAYGDGFVKSLLQGKGYQMGATDIRPRFPLAKLLRFPTFHEV